MLWLRPRATIAQALEGSAADHPHTLRRPCIMAVRSVHRRLRTRLHQAARRRPIPRLLPHPLQALAGEMEGVVAVVLRAAEETNRDS